MSQLPFTLPTVILLATQNSRKFAKFTQVNHVLISFLPYRFNRNMAGHNTIKPSYSIPNHTTPGHHINITTKTSSFNVKNTTNIILSSSTVSVINNKSPNSKSGDLDMLFTLVFIACVVLALLLVISLFMVIVCWKVKTRRRSDQMLNE